MTDDLSSSRLDQMAHRTLNQVRKLQAKSLGYLLIRCSQMWGDRAIAAVNREAGGPVLREAHTRLLPYLQTAEGIRITDLAKAVGVTKQAVQPLVSELAMVGIVRIGAKETPRGPAGSTAGHRARYKGHNSTCQEASLT